jgi:hypothetical protein
VKIIRVTVNPKGEAMIETKGFQGSECRDASRFIEQALGRSVRDTATAELYLQQPTEHEVREGP